MSEKHGGDVIIDRGEFYPDGHISIGNFSYARAHQIDSGGPYSTWNAPGFPGDDGWWTVLNKVGVNVLVFISAERFCNFNFTHKEHAEKICEAWNENTRNR